MSSEAAEKESTRIRVERGDGDPLDWRVQRSQADLEVQSQASVFLLCDLVQGPFSLSQENGALGISQGDHEG